MSFLSKIGHSIVHTFTAPFRFAGNVLNMGKNVLGIVGGMLTGDTEAMKRNWAELKDNTKKAVFSGVESAFLFVGVGMAAKVATTAAGMAATVGGKVAATSTAKEAAKDVGGRFMNAVGTL